ncbi:hypothetical protein [Nocardia sp. NPDC046763]|uniref:hypothetical protein n=1 Tax=Nocardia sp. NPDC046763 TaxID=3155256 RepID=UPI00340C7595
MTETEARVLATLVPGSQLTIDQIARNAEISVRSAETGARSLAKKGFAVGNTGLHRNAWTLTSAGARYVASRRGRTVLDVPRS